MLNYFELISKKKEFMQRIEKKIFQLKETLLLLEEEKRNIEQKTVLEYVKLNQLQKIEEEMNLTNFIIALLILFFFLSVFTYPFLVRFGFSSLFFFFFFFGANAIYALGSFLLFKVMGRGFRQEEKANQGKIEETLSIISKLNQKRASVNQQYYSLKRQLNEFQTVFMQEDNEIQDIYKIIMDCLLKNKELSTNMVLDQLIEQSISREEQAELELKLKRVLSYLENK